MPTSPRTRFEEGCARGVLLYQADASGPVFPPRMGIDDWRESAGLGTVHSTTWVRPRDGEPRNIALVDLDEGFRMMSRVDAGEVTIGLRVRVRFDGADHIPVFVPA